MENEKIRKMSLAKLNQLGANAVRLGTPEAEEVLAKIDAEKASRKRKAAQHEPTYLVTWQETNRGYEGFLKGEKVAVIKKVANHSMTIRDVYHTEVFGVHYKTFEYIKDAKEAVASEITSRKTSR